MIGQGSGMSWHLLLGSPKIRQLVTIEIEPQMVKAARMFYPANRRAFDDLALPDRDRRREVLLRLGARRYDLIVSEPSNPWVSGVSGLFTTEFYGRVRRYLTDDGVFGQWLHIYELDDGLVLSVLAGSTRTSGHTRFTSWPAATCSWSRATGQPCPTPDWSVMGLPEVQGDLCRFRPLSPEVLDNLRLIGRRELAPLLDDYRQPNSDYYPVLDLGAELRRFRRDRAAGFDALSADWHNFVASVTGQRTLPGADPLARLPETPRVDARAVDAYLRSRPTATGPAQDERIREASFALQHLQLSLASDGPRRTGSSGRRT